MTLIFMDGCDTHAVLADAAAKGWFFPPGNSGSAADVVTNGGRYGGGCIRLGAQDTGSQIAEISYGATALTTVSCAANINFGQTVSVGSPTIVPIFILRGGGADLITVLYNYSTGNVEIRRGGGTGTLLQTIATTVTDATYYHWEFKCVISATVGTLDLYKDGVSIHSSTGQNTGSTAVGSLRFLQDGGEAGGARRSVHIDDPTISDGDIFGSARIFTLQPNGDTAQKDFSRSTGSSNSDLVNETPHNGDTDYVFSSTANHSDRYTMGNLSVIPANIWAVQVSGIARKESASARSIRTKLKSGASVYDGSLNSIAIGYTTFNTIYRLNPDGNVAWTYAAVNALEAGMEIT